MAENNLGEQRRGPMGGDQIPPRERNNGGNSNFGQRLLLQDRDTLTRTITRLRNEQELLRRTGGERSGIIAQLKQAEARKQLLLDDANAGKKAGSRNEARGIVARRLSDVQRNLEKVSRAEEGNDWYVRRGLEIRRGILQTHIESFNGEESPSFAQQLLLENRDTLTVVIQGLRSEQELFRRTGRDTSSIVTQIKQAEARKQLLLDDEKVGARAGSRSEAKAMVEVRLIDVQRNLERVKDADEGNNWYIRRGLEIRREVLGVRIEAFLGVDTPSFSQRLLLQDIRGIDETIKDLRVRAKTTGNEKLNISRQILLAEARKRLLISDRDTATRKVVNAKLADIRRTLAGVRDAEEGNEWYIRKGLETRRNVLEIRLEALSQSEGEEVRVEIAEFRERGRADPRAALREQARRAPQKIAREEGLIHSGISQGLEGLQLEQRNAVLRMVAPDIYFRLQAAGVTPDQIRTRLHYVVQRVTGPSLPASLANEIDTMLQSATDPEEVLLRKGIIPDSRQERELLRALAPMLGRTSLDRDALVSIFRRRVAGAASAIKDADTAVFRKARGDIPNDVAIGRMRAKRIEKLLLPQQEAIRFSVDNIPMDQLFRELVTRFGINIPVPPGGSTVRSLSEAVPSAKRDDVAAKVRSLGTGNQPRRTATAAAEIIGRLIVQGEIESLPTPLGTDRTDVHRIAAKLHVSESEIIFMKMLERRRVNLADAEALRLAVRYIPSRNSEKYIRLYAAVADVSVTSLARLYEMRDQVGHRVGAGLTQVLQKSPIPDLLAVEANLREYIGKISRPEFRRIEFDRLERILLSNQLPGFIKDFVRFGLIYNNGKLADLVINPNYGKTSPHLESIAGRVLGINLSGYDRTGRRDLVQNATPEQKLRISTEIQRVMFNDIFQISVFSNNKEVYEFVGKLVRSEALFNEYNTDPHAVTQDVEKRRQLRSIAEICEVLASISTEGIGISPNMQTLLQQPNTSLDERIANLCTKLQVRDASLLLPALERIVLGPLGYPSFNELAYQMRSNRRRTDEKNRNFALENRNGAIVEPGDIIKRSSDGILPHVLRAGPLAVSLSGRNAIGTLVLMNAGRRDNTPLDADFNLVTQSSPFRVALQNRAHLGDLVVVVKNPEQNLRGKYELYNAYASDPLHMGIRSGLPSSEISAFIYQPTGEPVIDNLRLRRIKFCLSQNSFYIPLYDQYQRLIFSPAEYDTAQNDTARITALERARNNTIPARGFIELYKRIHPYIKQEFEEDAGVSQRFRIDQHTGMVVDRFETNFANDYPADAPMAIGYVRAAIPLHDIGKHEAIVLGKNKALQHQYTEPFMRQILITMGLPSSIVEKMIALVNHDYIGEYVQKSSSDNLVKAAKGITELSKIFGCSNGKMFGLLKILYISDASSYISPITGLPSNIDQYFTYDTSTRKTEPTARLERKFSELESILQAA